MQRSECESQRGAEYYRTNKMAAKQKQLQVEGLESLLSTLKEFEGERIYVMFIGSIDAAGENWCPDCRQAEPVIEAALSKAPDNIVFILVVCGEKHVWKDPENEFRKSDFKLTEIPTVIEYGTGRRLGCEDCKNQEKADAFFTA